MDKIENCAEQVDAMSSYLHQDIRKHLDEIERLNSDNASLTKERDELREQIMTLHMERDRALAARQWQPIETAPKDGTTILIGREDDDVGCEPIETTRWCVHERNHLEHIEGDVYRKVQDEPYEFWNGNGHRATHWMPLPPSPTATEAKTG